MENRRHRAADEYLGSSVRNDGLPEVVVSSSVWLPVRSAMIDDQTCFLGKSRFPWVLCVLLVMVSVLKSSRSQHKTFRSQNAAMLAFVTRSGQRTNQSGHEYDEKMTFFLFSRSSSFYS